MEEGIGFGCVLAMVISFVTNKSIFVGDRARHFRLALRDLLRNFWITGEVR